MTASLLRSVLRRALAPALLASCFVGAGAACDDDDSDDAWSDGPSGRDENCRRGRRRREAPPAVCASSAGFVLDAPGAARAGVDPSTLWVRACVDAICTDRPLFSGAPELDRGEGIFSFDLSLAALSCGQGPHLAAISLYDSLARAPLFTDAREVSLACDGAGCRLPSFRFAVPADAFRCEERGALIGLRAPAAIALEPGAAPAVVVCVDSLCSEPIALPVGEAGIEPGLTVDVLVQGVERSAVEATKHVVELKVGPGRDSALFSETFELVLDPTSSFACEAERAPDYVLPLRADMFSALDPGGGRPPPYQPGSDGAGGAGGASSGGEAGSPGMP